ncbi:MAG: zinc ABC transporter substrate-binding protein, partial [Desulfobacterales bacterium]|nr:zinc ABC transporter substrate-binding protein [Desulfobacterales bacterium]
MKFLSKILIFICIMVFSYLGNAFAADKLPVFVSIVPQKYFVQQIGKDLVEVQAMVQPGASPATYEPEPQQMVDLATAEIYFAIGVPFENAKLEKIAAANPNMRVVHSDDGIEKIAMEAHHHHDDHEEKHHDKGEHHGEAEHGHEKGEHHEEDEHDKDHHEHTGL